MSQTPVTVPNPTVLLKDSTEQLWIWSAQCSFDQRYLQHSGLKHLQMQHTSAIEFQPHQTPSISRPMKCGLDDHHLFITSDNLDASLMPIFRMRRQRSWMPAPSNAVFSVQSPPLSIAYLIPIPIEYSPLAT